MTDEFKDEIRSRMEGDSVLSNTIDRFRSMDATTGVESGDPIGDGVMVDFNLTVNGVDEESGSRLVLNEDGRMLHGSLRAGEVDLEDSITLNTLEERWVSIITEAGVRLDTDAAVIQMRQVGSNRYVPHVVFGSEGETSPIPTDRLVSIVRSLPEIWNKRTNDLQLRSNIARNDFEGSEETIGSVEDMVDNL